MRSFVEDMEDQFVDIFRSLPVLGRVRVMLPLSDEKVALPIAWVGSPVVGLRREISRWGLLRLESLTWCVGCWAPVWALSSEMVALEVERRESACAPVKIRLGVGRIWGWPLVGMGGCGCGCGWFCHCGGAW